MVISPLSTEEKEHIDGINMDEKQTLEKRITQLEGELEVREKIDNNNHFLSASTRTTKE